MGFKKNNNKQLGTSTTVVRKKIKFFISFLSILALIVLAGCKKENLQDAILPETVATETSNSGAGATTSTNGSNGENGENGDDGTDGTDGENGEDGENGDDGTDGDDGADGTDGTNGTDGVDGADGATGPAGADGADGTNGTDGADGADGATGPQGPKGNTGTANVIYSGWFKPNPWKKTIIFGTTHFYYDKSAAGITQNILDKGVVLVYGKLEGYSTSIWPNGRVTAMPYTFNDANSQDTWSAYATLGKLQIDFVNSEGNYDASTISTNHSFRYIIIPGGKNTGLVLTLKGHTEKDLRNMSYEAVCAALNITE